jgi:coronin-1B/1C/6
VKATRVCWLGETDRIATTGFSKFRERQFGMWDSKDLSKALAMPTLDSSTGIIDLAYDNDSRILVLAGKVKRSLHQ